MSCDKRCFDSEKEAKKFAKTHARVNRMNRKQRVYFCDDCRAYHLTSQIEKRSNK